ncbi:hypothetical protein PAHAL_3G031300 [Panicum hallii]|uniref:Uncharacterized protein n=1 Tax=Panicum hallii TaxID=206008 RepID=A0A2T8KH05_9POAL|nr:hypothetical protein PAHAL_3G031300 [Panicum hallii]
MYVITAIVCSVRVKRQLYTALFPHYSHCSPAELYICVAVVEMSPECQHHQEPQERRRSDAGAAEVDDAFKPRLPLLPGRPPFDKLFIPQPGRRLGAASLPGARHGRGHHGQPVPPAHAAALAVLDAEAHLRDMPEALVARDGGVQRDAPTEHHGEPHHRLPREPPPVHGHRAPARRVHGASGGRVDEDPAERQVGGSDGLRRREALLHERVDAERRAQEPPRRGVGLHDARHDAGAPVIEVDGRDEPRGEATRTRRDGGRRRRHGRGRGRERERERVGEELPVALVVNGGHVAERGPAREAERAPGVRVGGEAAEGGARAAERGQGRAVEAAEHEGQDVRGQVLDGGRALPVAAAVGRERSRAAPVVAGRHVTRRGGGERRVERIGSQGTGIPTVRELAQVSCLTSLLCWVWIRPGELVVLRTYTSAHVRVRDY